MRVEVELARNRIILRSDRPTPGLGKRVAGANFSSIGGAHWSIPLTLEACYKLREEFGTDLRVGSALSAWARNALARQARMAALGSARDAELLRVPEVSPVLAKAMGDRIYQRVGARFVAEGWERGGALIGDDPGLGKTLEAIGGIIESGVPGPYLVICPKTAIETVWGREIPRWWPGARVSIIPEGRAKRASIIRAFAGDAAKGLLSTRPTFMVINPHVATTKSWWVCNICKARIKWKYGPKQLECTCGFNVVEPPEPYRVDEHEYPELFTIEWGAIVADESDTMLLRLSATPTQVRAGAELLKLRADGARIPLSGTPFRSRPHLFWGTLNWMFPKEYTSFWRWAETYYEVTPAGWGNARNIGEPREENWHRLERELDTVMIRRSKSEVAPDLPPKTYVGTPLLDGEPTSPVCVWLPMDTKQQRLYDQMVEHGMVALAGGDLNAIGVLAEMTRLKQFASSCGRLEERMVKGALEFRFKPEMPSNKFEYIWDYLGQLGFPDGPQTKVVISSQFTELVMMFGAELARRLGAKWMDRYGIEYITGQVTGAKRPRAVDRFNEEVGTDSPHIMLINTTAGGRMITLDTADHTFIVDRTWIPDDQIQVEDRTHRVSRPRPVFYHYLESANTIDQAIAEVNWRRQRDTHELLDGRRGVEFARQVMEAMGR